MSKPGFEATAAALSSGHELLAWVIEAHGGQARWDRVAALAVDLEIGGNILLTRFASPRPHRLTATIDTQRVRAQLTPYPRPGWSGLYEGGRVSIVETLEGRGAGTSEGKGRGSSTREVAGAADLAARRHWDDLDVLYFFGYSLWNYANTPFLFRWPGFQVAEGPQRQGPGGVRWRSLRVGFPKAVPTHCAEQVFYFDEHGLLARLDYDADVFGGVARGAHMTLAHQVFQGISFPTRRYVLGRLPSGATLPLLTAMRGRIFDVRVHDARRYVLSTS